MTQTAYLQHGGAGQPMRTERVQLCEAPLAWQAAGLTWTKTGDGTHIATPYMVRVGNRWRRVYRDYGTLYIGASLETGTMVTITE